MEIRTTVCEIFLNGWKSSQMIQRTRKCLCPHPFLKTRNPNVLRKWCQSQGNTVFLVTSQKTESAKYACETKFRGILAEDALAKQYLEQKSLVTDNG